MNASSFNLICLENRALLAGDVEAHTDESTLSFMDAAKWVLAQSTALGITAASSLAAHDVHSLLAPTLMAHRETIKSIIHVDPASLTERHTASLVMTGGVILAEYAYQSLSGDDDLTWAAPFLGSILSSFIPEVISLLHTHAQHVMNAHKVD